MHVWSVVTQPDQAAQRIARRPEALESEPAMLTHCATTAHHPCREGGKPNSQALRVRETAGIHLDKEGAIQLLREILRDHVTLPLARCRSKHEWFEPPEQIPGH
jgi:hypothetical protein